MNIDNTTRTLSKLMIVSICSVSELFSVMLDIMIKNHLSVSNVRTPLTSDILNELKVKNGTYGIVYQLL